MKRSGTKRKEACQQDASVSLRTEDCRPKEIDGGWRRWATWAGISLLFVGACAWGVLEVHYSGDTWIGLAAGRQILTEPQFPLTDTFSYTSGGQVWYNQNWLSHVFFWLLWDKLGSTALVVGTWAVSIGTFSLVLLATWFRGRSWHAAFLGATAVALGSRDWLSIRPATIQFCLLAAAWLAFSALISQGQRRRWWPMAALLLIYSIWPHAHGSFLFGFGLLGLFVGIAAVVGFLAKRYPVKTSIAFPQGAVLIGLGIVAVALGVLLSPYGVENLTHPFKVVESKVFRGVGEWVPPFHAGKFPPVFRFWIVLAVAVIGLLGLLLLRLLTTGTTERRLRRDRSAARKARRSLRDASSSGVNRFDLNVLLFDLAAVGIGLGMVMFARRFAPVFYILATPTVVAWMVKLAQSLTPRWEGIGRWALLIGPWAGAVATVGLTTYMARAELVEQVPPSGKYDLLDRVTSNYQTPGLFLEFLRRNGLTPNLMTDWKLAGSVMFCVPGAKVYIDGRAQQVYSEEQYLTYMWLINVPPSQAQTASEILERTGTDVLLLPFWSSVQPLRRAMTQHPQWQVIVEPPEAVMWARRGSQFLDELVHREQAGDLWWPEGLNADKWRSRVRAAAAPPYRR